MSPKLRYHIRNLRKILSTPHSAPLQELARKHENWAILARGNHEVFRRLCHGNYLVQTSQFLCFENSSLSHLLFNSLWSQLHFAKSGAAKPRDSLRWHPQTCRKLANVHQHDYQWRTSNSRLFHWIWISDPIENSCSTQAGDYGLQEVFPWPHWSSSTDSNTYQSTHYNELSLFEHI